MAAPTEEGTLPDATNGHHIELVDEISHLQVAQEPVPSPGLRDSKGWDGKARVDRTAIITNPEALSDPEYSDDENVVPGEELPADEGMRPSPFPRGLPHKEVIN
jgi:protein phosphatase 1 regulatory subunit 7